MKTKTNKELKSEISALRIRVTELVDEVKMISHDLQRFKKEVASDVKILTDLTNNL